jgi:hypothetical protein
MATLLTYIQAYCMPLVARLCFKNFTPGVWYMGDTLSYISSVYSVLWMTFIFILLLFPTYPNPDSTQMNFAVAVLGFVLVFCLAYYYFPKCGGKTFFTGPIRTIDEILENLEVAGAVEKVVVVDEKSEADTSTAIAI